MNQRFLSNRTWLAVGVAASLLLAGCWGPRRPPVVTPPSPSKPPSERERRALVVTPLPIPVDGVAKASLADSFKAPRSGGRRHRAIDIFAPRNTPVRSSVSGVVTRRRVLSLGGNAISVVDRAGRRHYYAHLETWAGFDVGDDVSAGDVIGYVGNSGNARRGPTHLHYAIYDPKGQPINPFALLKEGPGSFR